VMRGVFGPVALEPARFEDKYVPCEQGQRPRRVAAPERGMERRDRLQRRVRTFRRQRCSGGDTVRDSCASAGVSGSSRRVAAIAILEAERTAMLLPFPVFIAAAATTGPALPRCR
jgi:hypothetical protein